MWMTGYNDGGDPFNGRKLRPLVPRATTCFSSASRNAPTFSRFQGTDLLSFNHHLGTGAEQSRKELNGQQQQVVVSSRWNPTPEQLQTLEELYRRGTRTPSADQIQHITAQLRRYGKIEGKNVFYWFQNHKARERQKRRRQLESATDEHIHDVETTERNGSGGNKTGFEAGQTKSCWALPTNCSTLAEKNASMQRAATKAAVAECRTEGWVLFNEGELQQRRGLLERNGTWQMMQMSCSSPSTHLINYAPCTIPTQHSTALTCTGPSHETITTMYPKLPKTAHQHLNNIFREPYTEEDSGQTLQLFPIRSGGQSNDHITDEKETEVSVAATSASSTTPYQFFEFLPLKN